MPRAVLAYLRIVEAVNRRLGRASMYLVFAMMAILFWSALTRDFFRPSLWTLEMAQFVMAAYYLLGGPYSLQLGDHVRMDLLYGPLTARRKAMIDAVTVLFLVFYLAFLLYGGLSSAGYALEYGERSYSAWRPYMAPIKIVMCIGIFLMVLQAIAQLIRDLAAVRGESLP
ncbi:MAG TPA: TRAP transporter small permease subunit [Paracoccaceae bacterium]|nr:TRAP transporter small permease subunit [Paracoccaceae bacterium]